MRRTRLELAQRGRGRVAEQPLARDPVPVGAWRRAGRARRASAPPCAGRASPRAASSRASSAPSAPSAGRRSRSAPGARARGRSSRSRSSMYQPVTSRKWSRTASGVTSASSAVEEAHRPPAGACRPSASPSMPSRMRLDLGVEVLAADASSSCRSRGTPRGRRPSAGSCRGAGRPRSGRCGSSEPKKKRKTISPKRSRVGAGQLPTSSKPMPVDPLGHEHVLARERGDHAGARR